MKTNKTDVVKSFILEEIEAGRIKSGQRLPSCRVVASHLSINKITVNRAYNELEKEHMVFSIPRGGFYLIDFKEGQKQKVLEVDFRTVKPDDKLIPYREFAHVMNRAVDMYKRSLFGYESTGGLASLKETLKGEFQKDGVYTSASRIIITHGAQQAISLVLQSMFKSNKGKLLVEAPTYSLVLRLANHLEIDVIGIERKQDGFDYKELERLFRSGDVSAFYVIPRHHNPTGYILAEKDKQKIAELANKYNILVIEDDYLADLGSRKGSMPIHYYDISKSTVYIRSFSKTFMPGIRMGAAVLPEGIIEDVVSLKHITDLNTSKLPQAALDLFIKSGMYEKHIKKVKKSYEAKLKKSSEIFKAFSLKDIDCHIPQYGIFIWIKLPKDLDAAEVEKELENQGILVKAASEFFPSKWLKEDTKNSYNFLRLCISGVAQENIAVLADVISYIRGKQYN